MRFIEKYNLKNNYFEIKPLSACGITAANLHLCFGNSKYFIAYYRLVVPLFMSGLHYFG